MEPSFGNGYENSEATKREMDAQAPAAEQGQKVNAWTSLRLRRLLVIVIGFTVVGLSATIFLICVYLILYRPWPMSPERVKLVRQKAFLKNIAWRIVDINNRTGILLTSEESFTRTAFYPFQQGISELLETRLNFEVAADRLTIKTAIEKDKPIVAPLSQSAPAEATTRRMKFLLAGKSSIYTFVASQRKLILEYTPPLPHSASMKGELFIPKMSSELPRTDEELRRYLLWIKSLLGGEILQDGFGRDLRILLVQGTLRIQSAGADGVYDTPDDVVMAATLGES